MLNSSFIPLFFLIGQLPGMLAHSFLRGHYLHPRLLGDYTYDGLDTETDAQVNCINGTYLQSSSRCVCNTGYTSSGTVISGVVQMCDTIANSTETPIDYGNTDQVAAITNQFIEDNTTNFLGLPIFYWICIGSAILILTIIIACCLYRRQRLRRQKANEKLAAIEAQKKMIAEIIEQRDGNVFAVIPPLPATAAMHDEYDSTAPVTPNHFYRPSRSFL